MKASLQRDVAGREIFAGARTESGLARRPYRSRGRALSEAAALTFAEEHDLAAPRLLAVDLDGATAGRPALLMTALPGTSTIPPVASVTRLRALGAAAATLHRVATGPRPDLPLWTRPLADVDFAAMRRATGSSPLLEAAAEHLTQMRCRRP